VQPHQKLVRARQREMRNDLEVLQFEVREVEAVEEHQSVGALRSGQRARSAGALNVWPSLTATWIPTLALTSRTSSRYLRSTSSPVMSRSVGM
jgi:hypothetical protein